MKKQKIEKAKKELNGLEALKDRLSKLENDKDKLRFLDESEEENDGKIELLKSKLFPIDLEEHGTFDQTGKYTPFGYRIKKRKITDIDRKSVVQAKSVD